jgi:hypothetical protein
MLSDVSAILTEHKIDAEQDSLPLGIHFELESLDVLNMSEEPQMMDQEHL